MSAAADRGITASARVRTPFLLAVLVVAYAAFLTWTCAAKYRAFLYDDIDLAIFSEAVSNLLHGSLFSSIRGASWLGDHSSLNLFLIAPLWALLPSPLTLLIVQNVALALGAIPAYRLARRETGDELVALMLAAAWLLYPALTHLNLYEFHPEALSTPALLASFAALREGRAAATLRWALFALLGKEDVALVVGAMGVYALWPRRPNTAAIAPGLLILAAASLVFTFAVLKPLFAGGAPDYATMYSQWGGTPSEILRHLAREPWGVVRALFETPGSPADSLLKQSYWLDMLLPLAALPLLAPEVLLIALPVIAEHMLSFRMQQHAIVYQYTALVIPFFVAAAIVAVGRVARRAARRATDPAPSTGTSSAIEPSPRPPAGRPRALAAIALVLAAFSQLAFGPLTDVSYLIAMPSVEKNRPDPVDQETAAHRRLFLARVPRGVPVVAGFEFLAPLAGRDTLHAIHHVIGGRYTFSSRAFPTPRRVGALIADFANPRTALYVDEGSTARLRAVIDENHLGLAESWGTLRLYLRDAPSPPSAVGLAECSTDRAPIVFDDRLEWRGASLPEAVVHAGDVLEVSTCWRVLAPLTREPVELWGALDARGREVVLQGRFVGDLVDGPRAWPIGATVSDRVSLRLPHGFRPGSYELRMRPSWVDHGRFSAPVPATMSPDDPGSGLRIGRFEVLPPGH